MLNIPKVSRFFRSGSYIEKRRLIIRGSLVRAQLGPQKPSRFNNLEGFLHLYRTYLFPCFNHSFCGPNWPLTPPRQSRPTLKMSIGHFIHGLSRFEPSWAHQSPSRLTDFEGLFSFPSPQASPCL